MSNTPAGWHPDPYNKAPFRYWDGANWTEQTSQTPGGGQAAPPPGPSPQFGGGGGYAAGPPAGGGKSGGGKGKIIGAVVGGAVAVIVIIIVLVVIFGNPVWDDEQGESDLESQPGIQAADCPSGESADKGHRFTCEITLDDGSKQKVTLEIVDDDGGAKPVSP
jgi:hypothetical protein